MTVYEKQVDIRTKFGASEDARVEFEVKSLTRSALQKSM